MLKITINEEEYCITWKYAKRKNMYGVFKGTEYDFTSCYLYHIKDEIETIGYVTRYHKDIYDKNIARKESLKHAILMAENNGLILDKENKKKIWEAYHKMTNKQYKT